jgi:hypothetical protein
MIMQSEFNNAVVDAVRNHPAVVSAAIIGSYARQSGQDKNSDLDMLLVASSLEAVQQVRTWLPSRCNVLICAFHLTHYCTVLSAKFEKLDLAIFSVEDPLSKWVVHDYRVVKGNSEFEAQLARAAADCRASKAAHLNHDVCMDNILLLLITALTRINRGELLSAHAFVAMSADMILSLERRQHPAEADAGVLDPRRRVEKNRLEVARALHESLFVPPDRGIKRLGQYLWRQHRQSLVEGQLRVLECLLNSDTGAT